MRPLLLVLLAACRPGGDSGDSGVAVVSPYDDDDVAAIEAAALAGLEANTATGVQIAVWLDGAIVYEGQFGTAHPGTIVVGQDGSALTIAMPDLEDAGFSVSSTLTYSGLSDVYVFRIGNANYELVFAQDTSGTYRYARNRLFVGNRQDVVAKGPARPLSAPALAVRLAEARLSPLVIAP